MNRTPVSNRWFLKRWRCAVTLHLVVFRHGDVWSRTRHFHLYNQSAVASAFDIDWLVANRLCYSVKELADPQDAADAVEAVADTYANMQGFEVTSEQVYGPAIEVALAARAKGAASDELEVADHRNPNAHTTDADLHDQGRI